MATRSYEDRGKPVEAASINIIKCGTTTTAGLQEFTIQFEIGNSIRAVSMSIKQMIDLRDVIDAAIALNPHFVQ